MPIQKIFYQLLILIFANLYQHAKKSVYPSVHYSDAPCSDTGNVRVPSFLTMPIPKMFSHLLICLNLYQHAKNQLIPFVNSRVTIHLKSRDQIDQTLFLAMPNQVFHQLVIFVSLSQHAKNEAVSLICSEEIFDLKILQSNWLRRFWPISQEQNFSQI